MGTIIACTGHREFSFDNHLIVDIFKRALAKANCTMALSGMAQGADTLFAKAAIELGIPYKAICPFRGQGANWPEPAKQQYLELLSKAEEVIYTSESYHKHCFFVRDRYLVDKSDLLFALYDGREKGGTFYTYKYAKEQSKKTINIWEAAKVLSMGTS